jgi:hypothetical protein
MIGSVGALDTPSLTGGAATAAITTRRRRPPSPAEQERRRAWGRKWGALNAENARKIRETEG